MASTYPLDEAVRKERWDDSVKALVFFPSVLEFMSDNLDWTQDLGDAVLAQQGEVTDTIQRLRAEADQAGTLASTEQQRVEKAGDTIIIQPAQPKVVYVPTYDPVKVYGDTSPPATACYPNAYADASASYEAGYAAGQSADADSGGISSDSLIGFGVGALAGGLLTAAIMWDDDDDWNDQPYYRSDQDTCKFPHFRPSKVLWLKGTENQRESGCSETFPFSDLRVACRIHSAISSEEKARRLS